MARFDELYAVQTPESASGSPNGVCIFYDKIFMSVEADGATNRYIHAIDTASHLLDPILPCLGSLLCGDVPSGNMADPYILAVDEESVIVGSFVCNKTLILDRAQLLLGNLVVLSSALKWGNVCSGMEKYNTDRMYFGSYNKVYSVVAEFVKSTRAFVRNITSGDATAFSVPIGCAIDESSIYIADHNNSRIQILNKSTLAFVANLAMPALEKVNDVDVDASYIYVAAQADKKIFVFNKETLALEHTIESTYELGSVSVNSSIIAASTASHRLIVYDNTISIVPGVPTDLLLSAGNGKIAATWTAALNAVSYNVYWDSSPGVTPSSRCKTGVQSGYVQTGKRAGVTYYYRVSGVSSTGNEGLLSDEVSIKMPSEPDRVNLSSRGTRKKEAYPPSTKLNLHGGPMPTSFPQKGKIMSPMTFSPSIPLESLRMGGGFKIAQPSPTNNHSSLMSTAKSIAALTGQLNRRK